MHNNFTYKTKIYNFRVSSCVEDEDIEIKKKMKRKFDVMHTMYVHEKEHKSSIL